MGRDEDLHCHIRIAGRAPAPKGVAISAYPVFDREAPRFPLTLNAAVLDNRGRPFTAELRKATRGIDFGDLRAGLTRLAFTRSEADGIKAAAGAGEVMEAFGFEANRTRLEAPELS